MSLVWFGFFVCWFLFCFSFDCLSSFENGKTKDRAGKLSLNSNPGDGVKIESAGAILYGSIPHGPLPQLSSILVFIPGLLRFAQVCRDAIDKLVFIPAPSLQPSLDREAHD